MPTLFTSFVAEAAEGGVHLPMPPWGFGLLTLAIFAALLLLVWSFRHSVQTLVTSHHGTHADTAQHRAAATNPDSGRAH